MAYDYKKSVTYRLTQAAKTYRNRLAAQLATLGLHPGQDALLKTLADNDGQTMGVLAGTLKVRPPTVTKMISRLGAQGFVRRESEDRDARLARVYLTDEGRARAEGIEKEWKQLERAALAGIGDKDRKRLRKLIRQIEANLGAEPEQDDDDADSAEDLPQETENAA